MAAKTQIADTLKITDARRLLTDLVDRAVWRGQETTITRNGKPVARIVPIESEMTDFERLARATAEDSKDILRALE